MRRWKQLATLTLWFAGSWAIAQEWPQYRCDARHSGATSGTFSTASQPLWEIDLGKPSPAYIHQYRMCADATYSPISAEGLLFVPSNVSDQLNALDLDTGTIRWTFTTGGPVRYAPVYHAGKLYFSSDDGFLYAVKAASGQLLWKVRGVPEGTTDSLMLINGRMCSRWPARGACVYSTGKIFFGTGIWPEEGVYVTAVDAETGRIRWQTNDMAFIHDGIADHGAPYDIGLPPNGQTAVIDGKLAMTCGRSLAVWLDLETGVREPYTTYYTKFDAARGASTIVGNADFSVQGGNWFATRKDALPPIPANITWSSLIVNPSGKIRQNEQWCVENRPFAYAEVIRDIAEENFYTDPIVTEDTLYSSVFDTGEQYLVDRGHTYVVYPAFDKIVARDLSNPQWKQINGTPPGMSSNKSAGKTFAEVEFPLQWEFETTMRVLIKVGNVLIVGEENRIAAIRIPQTEEESAEKIWESTVEGVPVHTLFADGKLVTVTHTGHLHCFGFGTRSTPEFPTHILPEIPPHLGYAAVMGWDDLAQAQRLYNHGQRRVVVFERNPATLQQARDELTAAGLYGKGCQVLQVHPDMLFPPYWASVVEVNDSQTLGADTYAHALGMMRPFSGSLVPQRAADTNLLHSLIADQPGFELNGGQLLRTHAPVGAGDWSHEAAGPDNSFISNDTLVKWPLGLLWYSGDVDRFFPPKSHYQHQRHPYPLVKDGRMFIITGSKFHAVDIYTGNYLWERNLESTPFLAHRSADARVWGRPVDCNYVVADDLLYCITGEQIIGLSTSTGETELTFDVPASILAETQAHIASWLEWRKTTYDLKNYAAPYWTEFRLWENLLISRIGKRLVALDRHTGAEIWNRASTQQETTYTLGNSTIYALDVTPESLAGQATVEQREALLLAINPADGAIRWTNSFIYPSQPTYSITAMKPWVPDAKPFIGYNEKYNLIVTQFSNNKLAVLNAETGEEIWRIEDPVSVSKINKIYSPLILDDILAVHNYNGRAAELFDIQTGAPVGDNHSSGFDNTRACTRVLGNNHLLITRDATVTTYDTHSGKRRHFNSLRAGCSNNYIPAGGVLTAPILAHGCTCNYPMFSSVSLYHLPQAEAWRPAVVQKAWDDEPLPYANVAATLTAHNPRVIAGRPALFSLDVKGYGPATAKLDFGDGTNLSEYQPAIQHTWSTPGTYEVVLTAANSYNAAGVSDSKQIEVLRENAAAIYVACTGDDEQDGSSWATAKQTLQAGIDTALSGATVWVSNGTYTVSTPISVDKQLVVRKADGGGEARIDGGNATRCFNLLNTCQLIGLKISKGYAADHGGGVFCSSTNAVVVNCLITSNRADEEGGGLYRGTALNCTLADNAAGVRGGGIARGAATNSIVWGNHAPEDANLFATPTSNCCSPEETIGGIAASPAFIDSTNGNFRLRVGSPCIDAGVACARLGTIDLEGHARTINATVDLGAYEYDATRYDSDSDCMTDADELFADTNPTNRNDVFRLSRCSGKTIYFNSSSTRNYTLYGRTNLLAGNWTPLAQPKLGCGGLDSITSTNAQPHQFYKIDVSIPNP